MLKLFKNISCLSVCSSVLKLIKINTEYQDLIARHGIEKVKKAERLSRITPFSIRDCLNNNEDDAQNALIYNTNFVPRSVIDDK